MDGMRKAGTSRTLFLVFNHFIFIVVCLICVLPFVHLLAVSLSGSTAVAAGKVLFLPVDFTLYSYEYAIKGGTFLRAMGHSIVRIIVGTAVNLLLILLTAYPLSHSKEFLPGRNLIMAYFVFTMLIGGGMIPTYLVVVGLGLADSIWALILPGALSVSNMVIMMNFIRGLPGELQEAARIDGATEMQLIVKVMVPLLKPSLATVGLFSIVNHWNDWFSAVIYYRDKSKYPLATYLQSLLTDFEILRQTSGSDYRALLAQMNAQTGRAAQLFLGAVPMLLVYPFLQKHFASGLTLGSVKG